MSAKAIFTGKIATLKFELVNLKKGGVAPKLTIQLISDDSYRDRNTGSWIKRTSSFFITDWGPRAQAIYDNGTLQVGFGIYAEAKLTVSTVGSGDNPQYYTDVNLQDFEITSKPKSWYDNRNNAIQDMPQTIPEQQGFQFPESVQEQLEDQPIDDDTPF